MSLSHRPWLSQQSLFCKPFCFWYNLAVTSCRRRNFADKQPTTWQRHEMGYFSESDTRELIGVSNHVWKGHRGVWTENAHISQKTCVSDMLPQSPLSFLKFTLVVVIVAFGVHARLCVRYESIKKRGIHDLAQIYVHVIPCIKTISFFLFFMGFFLMACKRLRPLCQAAVTWHVLGLHCAAT